jgi:hypothetical protein
VASVVVSYARADGESFARRLATDLAEAGIGAWLDRREMWFR